jgi:hypothetical protein
MVGNGENTTKKQSCMGFLTVVECPRDGLFGGYLVVNLLGRPLEFRCTAPIKPNRAQQILYGPTLDPYLYGEQIGYTLLKGSDHRPSVVFTDLPAVLAASEFTETPLAVVEINAAEPLDASVQPARDPASAADTEAENWRLHAGHAPAAELEHFHFGQNRLATAARLGLNQAAIAEWLAEVPETFDLAEPFVRIRSAIEEARGAGGG